MTTKPDLNAGGATATVTPTKTATSIIDKPKYTPGPLAVKMLIEGQGIDPARVADPQWRGWVEQLVNRPNGKTAGEVWGNDILAHLSVAERQTAGAAVLAFQSEDGSEGDGGEDSEPLPPIDLVSVPKLPGSAQLPDKLLKDLDGAGQWLTDYVNFASKASPMSPRSFHEVLGLTLLAASVARRVVLPLSKKLYTNLYSLLVAPSTKYRKSTAFDIANQVLDRADLRRLTLPARMTPESLLSELTGRTPNDFGQWDKADQDDWQDERPFAAQRAWLMEEAASLLDSFKRESKAELLPIVLDLYDCPNVRAVSTIGRGRQTVRRAYLTICGPTTPAALKTHLASPELWSNGLWARFIFVTPDERPQWQFWPDESPIPDSLAGPLKALTLDKLPMPKNEILTPAQPPIEPVTAVIPKSVWERWEAYAKALEFEMLDNVPARFHANYGRFATFAIKVAILLATMDWAMNNGRKTSPTIGLNHWARAQVIVEQWRANLHRLAELPNREGMDEDLTTKVLRYLPPKEIRTPSEIARDLGRTESHQILEIKSILELLREEGTVERAERKRKRGPVAKGYRRS